MALLETVRAKAGAIMLDIIDPGWANRIRPDELDLSSCHSCVLGQRFGSFAQGAERIFAMAENEDARMKAAERAGFYIDKPVKYNAEYGRLTKAWKREIEKRVA